MKIFGKYYKIFLASENIYVKIEVKKRNGGAQKWQITDLICA
jgi:hypothetical protein